MYRWVDHTAELELSIEAATERDVFVDGLAAFRELLAEDLSAEVERRELALAAVDRPTLLADWLAEIAYLAEVDGFVAERVVTLELDGDRLVATVDGRRGRPRHLVKAVTYHGLAFGSENGLWRARVVLDV